jgi:MoaA/NifB/PqqE/SkfB family radical SAM enzyme
MSLMASLLNRGAFALLPFVGRRSNQEILSLLPSLPGVDGLLKLSSLPGRDSLYFFLNFLRHLSQQNLSAEKIKEQVQRYLINPTISSEAARAKTMKQYGFRGLSSLIMTPTVACNLRCEHCYNLYEIHEKQKEQLSLEIMLRVVTEAKAMGAYRLTIIGGEPLLRWRDLASLAAAHPDALLTVFTNGLLLTPVMAEELARLGNLELAFSIDGFEEEHDRWRGVGNWKKTLQAMSSYHQAGGMALASPTVTSENYQRLLSDAFLDLMKQNGAYMSYLHHYDLIGGQARVDWLLTPSQLSWMKQRIEEVHQTKSITVLSNVTSNLVRGGCPAVRDFVHINHKGEVEPCCMIPFAADSVYQKSLTQILLSPFLKKLSKVKPDASGIKRCLGAENFSAIRSSVESKEAFGTTKESAQQTQHIDMPTCFSVLS